MLQHQMVCNSTVYGQICPKPHLLATGSMLTVRLVYFLQNLKNHEKLLLRPTELQFFQHIHWFIISVFIWDFVSSAFALYLVRLTFLFNKYHWVHQLCLLSLHLGPSSSWPCSTECDRTNWQKHGPSGWTWWGDLHPLVPCELLLQHVQYRAQRGSS